MAESKEDGAAAGARVKFYMRMKQGTEMRWGPLSEYNRGTKVGRIVEPQPGFTSGSKAACAWSANGARFAVTDNLSTGGVTVHDGESGAVLFSHKGKIAAIALSPKGTYLLTWQKYKKEVP